jgi:membrane protein YqaA with SNARE-associated domain
MNAVNPERTGLHRLELVAIHLGRYLAHYGGWGLFAINFLDSSFLAFPVLNDVLLIHLAARSPAFAALYAVQCTAGSVAGSFVIYGFGRGGGRIFKRNPEMREAGRARRWLRRNDFATVLVASLLPPPTPFKVVPIVAGALEIGALRVGTALVLGRGFRFALEAWVGAHYGAQAENYMKYHLAFFSLATAVLVVGLALIYHWLQKTAPVD